jgi:hypothetical protein
VAGDGLQKPSSAAFYGDFQMALTDVALCSRALIRIGAAPITSFDDGTAEAEIAGALFGPVRDALLSAYAWSFASGQVALEELETPANRRLQQRLRASRRFPPRTFSRKRFARART